MGKPGWPLANSTSNKGLRNFKPLNSSTSVFIPEPSGSDNPASNQAPDLIILCSWMDALPQHIDKYTTLYQNLYPSAQILLIRNEFADLLYRSELYQQQRLQPAAEFVLSHTASSEPKILLHAFSNGGGQQACQLAKLWRRQNNTTLPISGLILDSSPSRQQRGDFSRTIAGMAQGLPRYTLLRIFVLILLHFGISCFWFMQIVMGMENVGDMISRDLNDERVLRKVPRWYFYSKDDRVIDFTDIEGHAFDFASHEGTSMRLVRFEGTGHVAHVVGNERKYCTAVAEMWQACLEG